MRMGLSPWYALVLVALVALVSRSLFMVDQGSLVLVRRFERIIAQPLTPGIHLKWPLVDQVIRLDGRLRPYQSNAASYRLADGEHAILEVTVLWRISDARRFVATTAMSGAAENAMQHWLAQQVSKSLLERAASHTLAELLTQGQQGKGQQGSAMHWPWVAEAEARHGVEIQRIWLSRLEPQGETRQSFLARMRALQEAKAHLVQTQGEAEAQRWKERADSQAAALLAEAKRRSAALMGEGIVQALAVLEPARRKAPALEAMLQAMEVVSLAGQEPCWPVPPDDPFFALVLQGWREAR